MNQLLLEFKNMDNSIICLMKKGVRFYVFVSIIATIILLTYDFLYTYPIVYNIGISLFKTSLCFITRIYNFWFCL